MESLDQLLSSRHVRVIGGILGTLLLSALIFHAGVVYGERHASPFGPRPNDGFRPFLSPGFNLPRGFIEDSHGAVGVVQSIASSTFVMVTRDGNTETVSFQAANTPSFREGDHVLVVGEPDGQGYITAKIIKVLRPQP